MSQIEEYKNKWNEIKSHNSDLRLCYESDDIEYHLFKDYYKFIYEIVKEKGPIDRVLVRNEIYNRTPIKEFLHSLVYSFIITNMIKDGYLISSDYKTRYYFPEDTLVVNENAY